MHQILLTGY